MEAGLREEQPTPPPADSPQRHNSALSNAGCSSGAGASDVPMVGSLWEDTTKDRTVIVLRHGRAKGQRTRIYYRSTKSNRSPENVLPACYYVERFREVVGSLAGDTEDRRELCAMCGERYGHVWRVADDLWREVTGWQDGEGQLCRDCFEAAALEFGRVIYWTATDGWPEERA